MAGFALSKQLPVRAVAGPAARRFASTKADDALSELESTSFQTAADLDKARADAFDPKNRSTRDSQLPGNRYVVPTAGAIP